MPFSFGVWSALINNFAIEYAAFDGADMGALQSLREVPGFLSFTVIFLLFIFREQTLAVVFITHYGVRYSNYGLSSKLLGALLHDTVNVNRVSLLRSCKSIITTAMVIQVRSAKNVGTYDCSWIFFFVVRLRHGLFHSGICKRFNANRLYDWRRGHDGACNYRLENVFPSIQQRSNKTKA